MNEGDGPYLVAGVLWLVLVVSSLVARRIPFRQTAKMALAWIGIFAVFFTLFAFRGEFYSVGQRLKSELLGTPVEQGGEIRIPMAEDGHFWTIASVNGRDARFLIDSGATTTTIAAGLADELGLEIESGDVLVDTANGSVAMGRVRAEFRLAGIVRPEMRLLVNPGDDSNVLGMNFLSSLSSWRVEGQTMVLRP